MTEFNEHFITTFTGKKFHYLNPALDEICIEDIAHALALTCRFGGHCHGFYCVAPETKVLTADLRWVDAGSLILKQPLIAFEEYPIGRTPSGRIYRRKIKPSLVTATSIRKLPTYKFTMGDGTELIVSEDHTFLAHTSGYKRNVCWKTARELCNSHTYGKRGKPVSLTLPKYFDVWETDNTYAGGFISASFDGEGYLHTSAGGLKVFYSQKSNPMYDMVKKYLNKMNIPFSSLFKKQSGVNVISVTGGYQYSLGFLGRFRPPRLMARWANGEQLNFDASRIGAVPIVSVTSLGVREVVAIGTSTKTLFTNGFASHNSVADHSLRVAQIVDRKDRLAALLHDAHEAYLHDVPRPIKRDMIGYSEIADRIQGVINTAFGVVVHYPDHLKFADDVLLATEARDLLSNTEDWAELPLPLTGKIRPLSWLDAQRIFLDYYVGIK